MAGPWEKYQATTQAAPSQAAPSGPWSKYQPQQPPAPPVDAGTDALKSAAGGLERGAAAAVMAVPDLINAAVAGPQLLGRGVAEGVDKLIGIEPQPRGELYQPFIGSEEALHKLPVALQPHDAQTPAGMAADLLGQLAGGAMTAKAAGAIGSAEPPRPTADEIRAKASAAYAKADQLGGSLPAKETNDFIAKAQQSLPQTAAGKLVLGETPSTKLVERLQGLGNRPLSLAEAQEIDAGLGEAASGHIDPRTGKPTADGKKFLEIQDALRNTIENAQLPAGTGFDALQEGRALWAQQARLRDIENIITRAEMMDNPATGIKTGFRTLFNNPSRMRGFTDEESKLIKNAAESGYVTDLLRTFGSRLLPIGSLLDGGGISGAVATDAMAAASRNAASKLQVGKAEKVAEAIAGRNFSPPSVQPLNPNAMPAIGAAAAGIGSEMDSKPAAREEPAPAPIQPTAMIPKPEASLAIPKAPTLIDRMAQAESSGNPNARNSKSSASGILQFTDGTWAQMVARYGKQEGITLKDKANPAAQAVMAQHYAADNAKSLAKTVGREPSDGELYMAHFLGPNDAAKLINAQGSGKQAIMLFPRRAVADNRAVFFDGKRPRTVEEVYQLLENKVS